MDHQQHDQDAGQTALTFAEWCVLLGGNRFLDGLEEGVAREKVRTMLERPSSRTAAGAGGRSVWLNHCTPGCLCHEDCDRGKCVHGSPLLQITTRKPPGIFAEPPPAHLQGVPHNGVGRTLPAGAEGSGGGRRSVPVDGLIDKVTNGYCSPESKYQ